MNKKQRASLIQEMLDHYIPNPKIPLDYQNLFTLLMATILSGGSTDAKVNQITPALFAKANTPKKFKNLSFEEVEAIIHPCGLSKKKAKILLDIADILLEKFSGKVPGTLRQLKTLPGVGQKTASVVLALGFKKPAFPVDCHIHRCAKRWKLSSGKNVEQTEKDLKKLFPQHSWNQLHLQIILFARKFCTAKAHKHCPICDALPKD